MSSTIGVANHPNKDLIESLWRSGLRTKAILEYLEENDLPLISYATLSRYGQRNWSDEEKDIEDIESDVLVRLEEIESSGIGNVERISVSKTGFNISIKPKTVVEAEDDIRNLPKAPRIASKRSSDKSGTSTHVIIPDTQIEPGRPTEHLRWPGMWIKDHLDSNIKIIHVGDHWNMGSLSSYDKGKGAMEGRRYLADIESGNESFETLDNELPDDIEKHFLLGNHENRVNRATECDIQLEGLLTTEHMLTPGWERHNFLEILELDGVAYSHYFYHPNTGKPYGGDNLELRLKNIGRSFVMGHQQGLKFAQRYVGRKQLFGLVAGSFYLHEEEYMGPQATGYWRGIVVLHNVHDGTCEDAQFVSMNTLQRLYG